MRHRMLLFFLYVINVNKKKINFLTGKKLFNKLCKAVPSHLPIMLLHSTTPLAWLIATKKFAILPQLPSFLPFVVIISPSPGFLQVFRSIFIFVFFFTICYEKKDI